MPYYLYILECRNGHYYTGYTVDINRRYQEHLRGINCKYTRSFPPKRLAACWEIQSSLSIILKLERKLKQLSKNHKIALTQQPEQLITVLPSLETHLLWKPWEKPIKQR